MANSRVHKYLQKERTRIAGATHKVRLSQDFNTQLSKRFIANFILRVSAARANKIGRIESI